MDLVRDVYFRREEEWYRRGKDKERANSKHIAKSEKENAGRADKWRDDVNHNHTDCEPPHLFSRRPIVDSKSEVGVERAGIDCICRAIKERPQKKVGQSHSLLDSDK